MVKVCPSSCHLAQVTPNVTFLWTQKGKEQLQKNNNVSSICSRLKIPREIYACASSFLVLFTQNSLIWDHPLCRWPGKQYRHGFEESLWNKLLTLCTHAHLFIAAKTWMTAVAFLPCACVCVLTSTSLGSGGVVTSWATGPSSTHFLYTPATSPQIKKLLSNAL